MMKTIKNEGDVRVWLRETGLELYWVEPAPGGTAGLPDSFVYLRSRHIWIELKCSDGLTFTLTHDQRKLFPRLVAEGAALLLLLGLSGTNRLLVGDLGRMIQKSGLSILKNKFDLSQFEGMWTTVPDAMGAEFVRDFACMISNEERYGQ